MSREMRLAEQVIDRIGTRAEAEVRVVGGNRSLTRFANSYIHQNVAEEGESIQLRVAADGRVASATTTRTDEAGLRALAEDTLQAAALQPVDEHWPGLAPRAAIPIVDHVDEATVEATPQERADIVQQFVAAGDGLQGAGYCETHGETVAVANSAGQRAQGRRSEAVLDGIHQTEESAGSGHATSARVGDLNGAAVGALAAARARDSAKAVDLKPGEYQVVLGPECVATISAFLSFYGFNAKAHLEGQSFAEIGTTQFDEQFDLWDDVADERALGVAFDSEGTPKRRLDLVRDGVTVGLTHDRRTATRSGTESTGHAFPGSEVYGPFPSSVFTGTGGNSEEELIAAVDRGLYVATFNYCRVLDPKTLVVTGLTRNGTFLIEQGEITGAVSNLRFTQSFVAGLGPDRILGIGDNARFADSEFGSGLMFVPSMRLAAWSFTGGAEG